MKKGLISRIISIVIIVVIAVALVIGNNLAMAWADVITSFLCGTGDDFSNATETLAASDELCQEIEEEGIVLLKNNGALPLASTTNTINLFGYGATDEGFLLRGVGSGSSTISESNKVTLIDAFSQNGISVNEDVMQVYSNFILQNGSSVRSSSPTASDVYLLKEPATSSFSSVIDDAVAYSDVAVFVLSRDGGENISDLPKSQSSGNSSGTSKTYLEISDEEDEMLTYLDNHFSTVIVLLNTSNTMHTGFLDDDRVDAALFVGLTGQSGAMAIPKILTGEVNPSGKTTDTYTYEYVESNDPTNVNTYGYYFEGIYSGYKWYETADVEGYFGSSDYGEGYDGVVQYPFGYGLSYTEFEWEVTDVTLEEGSILAADSEITITVEVTNTGDVSGKDVVELYFTPPYYSGGIEKAEVNLLDFVKTPEMDPGETVSLQLSFTAYDMASYDDYDKNNNNFCGYELDGGTYSITLRTDAHTVKDADGMEITYTVADNGIKFETDPTTGNTVENRFTGDTAYAGVPTDGSTAGISLDNYMTRADFSGSFPSSGSAIALNSTVVNSAANYINDVYDEEEMPTTGTENNLRIMTLADGTYATLNQLNGSGLDENNGLVWNDELVAQLAEDYDSDLWDQLLDQLTTSEMKDLVELGGFHRTAMESVGISRQYDYDGPAGFNTNSLTGTWGGTTVDTETWTAFPSETIEGCTWSKTLMFELGRSMGAEADATSINGWYAPGVNLHRTSYTGRNYEYYSEDAILSGKMAAMVIYGAKTNGLTCYLKHFACSDAGNNPNGYNTWVNEQTLREICLKPFEIAVKEGGANAMMSAFNRLGASWCGANYALLTEILRDEWGFEGAVITDWTSGQASIGSMNVVQGVRAGNDLWLCPYTTSWTSNCLSKTDAVDMYCARQATHDILYMTVDTRNTFNNYDADEDDVYAAAGVIGFKNEVFAWWKPVLYVFDGVVAVGLVVWLVFIVKWFITGGKPKDKKSKGKPAKQTE